MNITMRTLCMLILSMPACVIGQEKTGTMRGSVIDGITREPIGSARVTILGTGNYVVTSKDGQFQLNDISPGFYQVKAEADKYESRVQNNIEIERNGNDRVVFFSLNPKSGAKEAGEVEHQPDPIYPPIMPKYPAEARKKGVEGVVYVKLLVNEKGIVEKAVVEQSDDEIFNQASIDAALKWRFKPAIQKGVPVSTWIVLPFKFKLSNEDKGLPQKK